MFGNKRVTRIEFDVVDESSPQAEGFSLDDLGSAYAQAMGKSNEAVSEPENLEQAFGPDSKPSQHGQDTDTLNPPLVGEEDGIVIQPESIIEAMLFLGASNNEPLSGVQMQELLRGVSPEEIDRIIHDLNQSYRTYRRAFEIVREPGGYRLQLVNELVLVRDRFYGKIKETQLTQSAIDCLALVAYQPGISRAEIENQWSQPASNMLSTLVRRGLLMAEKATNGASSDMKYFTTERFLEIAGLASLSDLPSSEEA